MRSAIRVAALVLAVGCGGGGRRPDPPDVDAPTPIDALVPDAYLGDLLGYACELPPEPDVAVCSSGPTTEGAYCVDGGAGDGVCRPICNYPGTTVSRCAALHGVEFVFRGVCVCVPQ